MTAQVYILSTAMDRRTYERARTELRSHAEQRHAEFPQYDGKFAGWVLGVIRQPWRGKGGSAFSKGEIVLMNPIPSQDTVGGVTHTVYCSDTGWNCAVDRVHVEPVPVQ